LRRRVEAMVTGGVKSMHDRTFNRLVTKVFLPRMPGIWRLRVLILTCWSIVLLCATQAMAATYVAHPEDYHNIVPKLGPGDILRFKAGIYTRGLKIHELIGTSARPIVIEGPANGELAVLLGQSRRNVVSIKNSSYVVLRNLEIDGRGTFVDGVKAKGNAGFVHHITL
jgi:hypothetical protein